MMRARRLLPVLAVFCTICAFFCAPAGALVSCAESGQARDTPAAAQDVRQDGISEEEKNAIDALPEEYTGLFVRDGRLTLPGIREILEALLSAIGTELKKSKVELSVFLGSILLCSVFTILQKTLSGASDGPLRWALLLAGCLSVFGAYAGLSKIASDHLYALLRLLGGYIPAVTASQAAMGGIGSAALTGAAFGMFTAFIGQFTLGVLFPMMKCTLALDLCSEISHLRGITTFSRGVRGLYLTLLGVITALLSGVFALQHVIAAKTDSLSLRAFRLTAGSAIPLVGSAVSEASKTLLSGLSLIRATIGAVGVCLLLMILLPNLILLLCARLCLRISSGFAAALDASPLDNLFAAGAGAAAGLIAAVCITDLGLIVGVACTMYSGG